ncbi:MAG: DUF3598 family protein [Cyanobacteria bacterium J06632_3]
MSETSPKSPDSPSSSQWQRLLKNTGLWQGSFTQISPQGRVLSDVKTEVELAPYDNDQAMHQEVRRYPPDESAQIQKLDYRTLNRATLFFENGAFSQGSMQWGPYATFGAELGLIAGQRRLRLVQLFDKNDDSKSALKSLTLIRETLKGGDQVERPPLQVSDLLGTWRGEAVTQYADLRPEQHSKTQLTVDKVGDSQIRQAVSLGPDQPAFSSVGTIESTLGDSDNSERLGKRILFTGGSQSVQVLLLPDGASATCPTIITPRQPLFLEVGWLLTPQKRQRLIRRYGASGEWESLTLVTEYLEP